jgi:hypothetical protein
VKQKSEKDPGRVNNWYSQHLYTVCHLLECMPAFPELAPDGQDHILGSSVSLRDVAYAKGSVRYASAAPAEVTLKLSFAPKSVSVGQRPLGQFGKSGPGGEGTGWSFDAKTRVLTLRHAAGEVSVTK